MHNVSRAKLKFVVSLTAKHAKHGNRSIVHKVAMANLDKLNFEADDTVLDVGCGSGDETVVMATMVKNIVAVDPVSDILEIAKREYPADNVDYLLDDLGEASPNAPRWLQAVPFSKAVSFDRIMVFPKVANVLRTAVACLRPGGALLVAIPNNAFNFFAGPIKIVEANPEWRQDLKSKKYNCYLWNQTEAQTEAYFKEISEWSTISCQAQRFTTEMSEQVAKAIWLDLIEEVGMLTQSQQTKCLQTLWEWAKKEYELTDDGGCIKKPSEFMVVHGVKQIP